MEIENKTGFDIPDSRQLLVTITLDEYRTLLSDFAKTKAEYEAARSKYYDKSIQCDNLEKQIVILKAQLEEVRNF